MAGRIDYFSKKIKQGSLTLTRCSLADDDRRQHSPLIEEGGLD